MPTDTNSRSLKTTETSLDIINLLSELGSAGVTQIAERLNKPPSTIHGHLSTLEQNEYIIEEGGIYRLGLKFLDLGNIVRYSRRAYLIADKYTRQVTDKTGCRSIFGVEEHGRGVYISRDEGDHSAWVHEMIGNRFSLHNTAAGKVILANLPKKRVETILDRQGLPQQTPKSITNRKTLLDELDTVREQGVGFNREEEIKGIRAVSAPVTGRDGRIIGALSANGPANQLVDERFEREIPKLLKGIANEFELDLALAETP